MRVNHWIVTLATSAMLASATTGAAQSVGGSQAPNVWTQGMNLYVQCLQDLGIEGNYTWTDGGKSAIRLANACSIYERTVIQECMALYFHPDENTCRATTLLYAQTVLRALHK